MWPFKSRTPKLATRIAITPPKPAASRDPLALVLIARNEGKRLADWLTFHAIAGVSHVILYDNGSTDDTVAIALNFKGCPVTIVPWMLDAAEAKTGMVLHRQILAYAHAICTFGSRFERMGFVDTDEYLVPRDALTLPQALATLPHPNISIPWTMFGHNGHTDAPTDAVPFAFVERAPISEGPLLNFKCIIAPCEVTLVNTHRFETRAHGAQTSNTQNVVATNKQRSGDFVCYEGIQLNHYYLLSRQEMLAKISGPAVSGSPHEQRKKAVLRKAELIEAAPIRDTCAVKFLALHGVTDTSTLRSYFEKNT